MGESCEKEGSSNRLSRPGSWTGQTSISGGRASGQERNIEAPPPACGKQNRRKCACGFGLGLVSQGLNPVRLSLFSLPLCIAELLMLHSIKEKYDINCL